MGIVYEREHKDTAASFFSIHSEREPVANFVNNVASATVATQIAVSGTVMALEAKPSPELTKEQLLSLTTNLEILANLAGFGLPIAVTLGAFFLLHENYKRKPAEEKEQIRRRLAEVSRDPRTLFRRTARAISHS